MDFRERILTQVLCNLIHILYGAWGQWSELKPEDLHLPKALRMAQLSPAPKFELGPFESLEDHFYRSNQDVQLVDFNSKRILERIRELLAQYDRAKTDNLKTWKRRRGNEEGRAKNKPQKKAQVNGDQVKRNEANSKAVFEALVDLEEEVNDIKNQIKQLGRLSNILGSIKEKIQGSEKALSPEFLEKLMEIFGEDEWVEKMEEKERGGKENRNKILNENEDGRRLQEMNNISYNNQYQIDAIFIINRLSEGRENFDSKFNEYKGTDVEIFKELTGGKMKELFEKKLNNLNADSISKATEGDFPKVTHPPLLGSDMDLVEELQRNFTKIFTNQNVSLDQINQMSQIIDFVERYHGIISSRGGEENGTPEDHVSLAGSRTNRRILPGGKLNFFNDADLLEHSGARKKGSVT